MQTFFLNLDSEQCLETEAKGKAVFLANLISVSSHQLALIIQDLRSLVLWFGAQSA